MHILSTLFWIVVLVVWLWALVDILKSDFKDSINKLIWLAVVFVLGPLGVLLYYFIGRNQKR